jgi:cytochrome b6-f complex iron-sulfur subunit
MNRKDFLEKLGIGAAFVLTTSCFYSCTKDESTVSPVSGTELLSLDLSDAKYSKLNTNGNYMIINDIVVAKGINGEFLAATVECSHENEKEIIYDKSNNEWFCTSHDARFNLSGVGLNSKGSKGLKVYKTLLSNNLLKVTA